MSRVSQTRPRRYKWLLVVLAIFLALTGAVGWLVASESGLRWLVGITVRKSEGDLSVNGISGRLIDTIVLQQLVLRGDSWRVVLHGVQLECKPAALLHGELEVLHLNVREVEILSLPSNTPSIMPASLGLPLHVNVKQVKIDSFSVITSEGTKQIGRASCRERV